MVELLFAIPAFNEEATIGSVVEGLVGFGQVLVVDDGSRDATTEAARAAGATVHQQPANAGYDAAIRTCLVEGRRFPCDWLVTVDADGQHDPGDIENFRPHFRDNDLILGYRPRRSMRIAERLLGFHYQRKHHLRDPLTGFKAYRRDMLRRTDLPPAGKMPSYGLDALDAVLGTSPRIAEAPISIRQRRDDARVGGSWNVNKRMLGCLYKRLGGRADALQNL